MNDKTGVFTLDEAAFGAYLQGAGMNAQDIGAAVEAVEKMKTFMLMRGQTFEQSELSDLKDYLAALVRNRGNTTSALAVLGRYSTFTGKKEFAIYLMPLAGAPDLYRRLSERVASMTAAGVRDSVFGEVVIPPRGSPPEQYPPVTGAIVRRLEQLLDPASCRSLLAGNMHGIPAEAFAGAKARFQAASGLDEFLDDEHRRKVADLELRMEQGRLFYEQEITPEVLEWVRSNKEVMSGERSGDRIYVTKIPFAPDAYLRETDPVMKRYYACHCPLAREALRSGSTLISPTWCYCSAGFAKLKYDVIFGQDTEAELLESPFNGDARCRFAIVIPAGVRM